MSEPEDDPITRIMRKDDRFARAAYDFVRDAMRHIMDDIGERRHVSAEELLHGVRDLAREAFGPLARTVIEDWGVHTTDDFGAIVFNLIDAEEFGKNDDDDLEDFCGVYSFEEAFPTESDDIRVADDVDEVWDG